MRGLICLLVACCLGCSVVWGQAPEGMEVPPPGWHAYDLLTPSATIVARRVRDAARAGCDVNRAVAVYRKFFHETPARGIVWIVDSREDLSLPTVSADRNPPWLQTEPSDRFVRAAVRPQFEERAKGARTMLARKYPHLSVEERERATRIVIDKVLESVVDKLRAVRELSHETGHALLRYWTMRRSGGVDRPASYGTYLPDWIDEGFAIRCEPAAIRADRIRRYRSDPRRQIPLARLLNQSHPRAGSEANAGGEPPAPPAIGTGAAPDTGTPAMKSRSLSTEVWVTFEDGSASPDFYGACAAFVEYLEARGGPELFAAWAAAAADEKSAGKFLASQHSLPASLPALQRDFERWLRHP